MDLVYSCEHTNTVNIHHTVSHDRLLIGLNIPMSFTVLRSARYKLPQNGVEVYGLCCDCRREAYATEEMRVSLWIAARCNETN